MAVRWQIPFMSLRTGTVYTVNIFDSDYSGSVVVLKGGAQPFETEELSDEDIFTPVRTQSGYIRIVDDGLATVSGVSTSFNWKQLIPLTDTARPVTLTDPNNNVLWHGFMQAQSFSGALYGNPQEREFPVQCPLMALQSLQPTVEDIQTHNFAYLIKYVLDDLKTASGNVIDINNIIIQGGSDAQQWLLKKFDWQNFLTSDEEEDTVPNCNMFRAFEDFCRFWGWSARTYQQSLYLMRVDDAAEQSILTLNLTQLSTMAGGTAAGSTSGSLSTATILQSDDVFASDNIDDTMLRGRNKAVVKSDCNQQDILFKFAPPSVEDTMDEGGYTWVSGGSTRVGYFTTPGITSFTSRLMDGTGGTYGKFARRQIFSKEEDTEATKVDCICISHTYEEGVVRASLQSKKYVTFGGGSLTISGLVYNGASMFNDGGDGRIYVRLGIGASRASAKWWYCTPDENDLSVILFGWSSSQQTSVIPVTGGSIAGSTSAVVETIWTIVKKISAIPLPDGVNEDCLEGYIFVDFLGARRNAHDEADSFEIGNFEISYSRDEVFISGQEEVRERVMEIERESSREYVATNEGQIDESWNADCIFASDNKMEYGYGLLMNANGSYMETAEYAGVDMNPEQQLANRVASFLNKSRRLITPELRSNATASGLAISSITPQYKVVIDGTTTYPVSISRSWRDDVIKLSLLEL